MTGCPDCTALADLAPSRIGIVFRLRRAGREDLAAQVIAGELGGFDALVAAGLRGEHVPPAPPPEPTADNATLEHVREGRTSITVDEATAEVLDAAEGDAVLVHLELACDEGPPERVTLTGIAGTRNRVWLLEHVDVDAVESVTLRRRRRV
jgi:hypothetical protein